MAHWLSRGRDSGAAGIVTRYSRQMASRPDWGVLAQIVGVVVEIVGIWARIVGGPASYRSYLLL